MVWPFVHAAPAWRWELRQESDLAGAAVNAELVSIDERGATLARQGQRHISIITPLLHLPEDGNRVLAVEACRPEVAADRPVETVVLLLWQTQPVAEYHFEPQTVALDSRLTAVRFSLPEAPAAMHRIGVQFPDLDEPVLVKSLSLPDLTLGQRLKLAWEEAAASEPIENHSINYIRGPRMLGHSLNYYLLSLLMGAVGGYGLVQVGRRRRVSPRAVVGIVLAVWVVADVQATRNLARQTHAEIGQLRGKDWAEQIAVMDGPEIAWAYSRLIENVRPGESFAVISDDPFTPSRRLAYLLAPERIWRESCEQGDYIVVLRAGGAVFDQGRGMFRCGQSPWMRVEAIAAMSADVYLLKRLPGPAAQPSFQPSPSEDEGGRQRPAGRGKQ